MATIAQRIIEYQNPETQKFFNQIAENERKETAHLKRMLTLVKAGLWFPEES